jgi:hypothetical protein
MSGQVSAVAPLEGFVDVEPVRLRGQITVRVYAARGFRMGGAVHMVGGPMVTGPGAVAHTCEVCQRMDRAEAAAGLVSGLSRGKAVIMSEDHAQKDRDRLLEGREGLVVETGEIQATDLIQDEGWIKEVAEPPSVSGDRVLVRFTDHMPPRFNRELDFRGGGMAYVWRFSDGR